MKRLFALLLAISVLLSCTACGDMIVSHGNQTDPGEGIFTLTTDPTATDPDTADITQEIQNLIAAEEYEQAYEQLKAIENPTPEQAALLKCFYYLLIEEVTDYGDGTVYTYDNRGNLLHKAETFLGETYEYIYTYDENDNLLTEEYRHAENGTEYFTKTEYTYNANGELTDYTYTSSSGETIRYGYTYAYDLNGNVTEEKSISYTEGYTWTERYTYDAQGNLLTQKYYSADDLTNTTTYTYDENGNMLSKLVEGEYTWDNQSTQYTYDENGNLIKEVRSMESYPDTIITYTYDENGNMVAYERNDWEGIFRHTNTYDENGNMIQSVRVRESYYESDTTTTITYTWQLFFNPNRAE